MHYSIFKLSFQTPVHFGDSSSARSLETAIINPCADTLFSALCHQAAEEGGDSGVLKLVDYVRTGELKFSDTLPYIKETLYLPKPYILGKRATEIYENMKKEFNKLKFIPVSSFDGFLRGVMGTGQLLLSNIDNCFGHQWIETKAAITGLEDPSPFSVGLFAFNSDSGLYVIIGYNDKSVFEWVHQLLKCLGISGMGGKISAGYGKFTVGECLHLDGNGSEANNLLYKMLTTDSSSYILATTALPNESELEKIMVGATYALTRRGGFVGSSTYNKTALKKNTAYFFSAGSVFKGKFQGGVYECGKTLGHKVFRYSVPIMLGVEI